MSVVESEIPAVTGPETPSEWFDHNVRATFHSIIENMLLRSESEKVVLHALVDDLDKDPQTVIAKLEIAPINQGGGGYVDPILAQVLADNAALRGDVQKLLDALSVNAPVDPVVVAAESQLQNDLATAESAAPVVSPPVATPATPPATATELPPAV